MNAKKLSLIIETTTTRIQRDIKRKRDQKFKLRLTSLQLKRK